jgi:hypothetical protein
VAGVVQRLQFVTLKTVAVSHQPVCQDSGGGEGENDDGGGAIGGARIYSRNRRFL